MLDYSTSNKSGYRPDFFEQKMSRWSELELERSPWMRRWRTVTDFILPFSGRYFTQDRNRGDKHFNNILDETGTLAQRVLTAGMHSGMTNPSRPWFRLTTSDPDLNEFESVKVWLNIVTERVRDIFSRSNTYRVLPMMYEEQGSFGTAATFMREDFDKVVWFYPMTVGEFAIATDARGKVNTMYRKYEMTVEQIVKSFVYNDNPDSTPDWSVVSPEIKNLWTGKGRHKWRPIIHAVEARDFRDRNPDSALNKDFPWSSCYLECGVNDGRILRESGFKDFPVLAPRWGTKGGDIYGYGPGFEAIGSIKQLQHENLRKGQAIDFMTMPPVMIPGDLKGRDVDNLPGGVNFYSGIGGGKIQSLYDIRTDLSHLKEDIQDVRNRINSAFYVDLFLMISRDERTTPSTAREIAELHAEKLLMLGPVLEQSNGDLLAPMIDNAFTHGLEAGLFPPPPPELEGLELKIEFISVLAQAQRAVGLESMDRLIGTVAAVAEHTQDPQVWDKVDKDQLIDEYAERLAVDPSVIVADENVAIIRESRKQQLAQQQMAQSAPAAKDFSQALKNVSEIPQDNPVLSGAAQAMRGMSAL